MINFLNYKQQNQIESQKDLEEGMKLIDTLDLVYPMSKMTIPKLADNDNKELKEEVDEYLKFENIINASLKKSTTYMLFGSEDNRNQKLKE